VSSALSTTSLGARLERWLSEPQPALRIEILRIGAPLAILGFMSSRIAHADEWIGDAGFRVPDLGSSDFRQPLYLPALPSWAAWTVAAVLVASGLSLAAGFRPRIAAGIFALVTAWVALSDRLAAFSVSKLAPVIAIALAASPCGARLSIDAWRANAKRRKKARELPTTVSSGSVRFFQLLVPIIYCASGIAKARGDWLHHPYVLWTHLHDTYQTGVTVALANALPPFAWTVLQGGTLALESLAPIWFGLRKTRPFALAAAVTMHAMIGLMFGPVRYFAMLMATLLLASHLPASVLERMLRRLRIS